jgi:tyrosine N-monooxygenase
VEVVLTESEMRFISFGIGRRGCVATSLGTAMTVMLFARLLQGFTWSKPSEVTSIDLSESKNNLYMAKPLVLHAEPRLPVHLYNLQP